MGAIASQMTSLAIVYLTVNSGWDQRKHQSSASLAFVWGIHRDRWIPRTKGQVRGKCFHLMTSSCDQLSVHAAFLLSPMAGNIDIGMSNLGILSLQVELRIMVFTNSASLNSSENLKYVFIWTIVKMFRFFQPKKTIVDLWVIVLICIYFEVATSH